jgi:hypothetical protein
MISIPFILNYNQNLKKNANAPHKRRIMSDEYFNQKMYILKKLNPEVFPNKNNLLFKSKSPFLRVFESNINRLKVQIENKSGSALVKNNTAAKTFDNIITQKTGRKILQETNQEESNTRIFYTKFYVYELINTVISLISVLLVVIYFEVTFNYSANDDVFPYGYYLLYLNLLSIALWINLSFYYYEQFNLRILNHIFPPTFKFIHTSMFKNLLLEIAITFLQPSQLFINKKYSIKLAFRSGIVVKRSVNSFLSLFVLTRIYLIDRFLIFQTDFMSPDSDEICRQYFFRANIKYSLIGLIKTKPFYIYSMIIISFLFAFQFIIKVFESAVNEQVDGAGLGNTFNIIYYSFITIYTVGYGDYSAKTTGGRIFVFLLSIIGNFLNSLFLMSLTKFFTLTPIESKQFNLLKKLALNEEKQKNAEKLVLSFSGLLKENVYNKNLEKDIIDLKPNTSKFMKTVKTFKKSVIDYEHHSSEFNNYSFANVIFSFQYLEKEYIKLTDIDNQSVESLKRIKQKLILEKGKILSNKEKNKKQ